MEKMKNNNFPFIKGDKIYITFNYSFDSGLGEEGGERYVNKVNVDIIASNDDEKRTAKIGEVYFYILLLDEATNSGVPFMEVLDSYDQYVFENGTKVIDIERKEYHPLISEHFDDESFQMTFCLFGTLKIHPKFRGYHLGAKVIKNIVLHYSSTCHLFALKPYPLQFEARLETKPVDASEYALFDKNEEKAFQRLINYYKKIGFTAIAGIDDLLFINTNLKNEALDCIDLDEYPDIVM